jgi:hypothetical protein
MPNQLDVPPELQFLIEKREQDDRRADAENSPADVQPPSVSDEERRAARRRSEDQKGLADTR